MVFCDVEEQCFGVLRWRASNSGIAFCDGEACDGEACDCEVCDGEACEERCKGCDEEDGQTAQCERETGKELV
ncbi:hypothetical protein ACOSQ2_029994 [Xanthoceras sorbifolium]